MLTEPSTRFGVWTVASFALCAITGPAHAQVALGECGAPATRVSNIQGSADRSPLVGRKVAIEAVVVADFRHTLGGLFVEEEPVDRDADVATSEGLFVSVPSSAQGITVGTTLRVTGEVVESNGLTLLAAVEAWSVCPGGVSIEPTFVSLPFGLGDSWERVEGMLVRIGQRLTVTGNFELGRYGSLELSALGREMAPTQRVDPGAPALALQAEYERARVLLDDASADQNPRPIPYLDAYGTRRLGTTLASLTGVVDARFGAYRIQPTVEPSFSQGTPRRLAPEPVGGSLRVAFMNTFNYFTTLDQGAATCGPAANLDCRGANSADELARQRSKLIRALSALDADIVGLSEIENNADTALQDLADALNAELDNVVYAPLATGSLGSDAIKLALLYKPERVATLGPSAVLDSETLRPALAQSFVERASAERITIVLAHFKSKSSACANDPDRGDGQGQCNQTRVAQARALSAWIAGRPTQVANAKSLLLGDFNAYAKEEPMVALAGAGMVPLVDMFVGAKAYSYQYAGQSGYLDHAFTTPDLVPLVQGVTHWHIDADEPAVLDYNLEFKSDDRFDPSSPFRASDHDPLLIGLTLGPPARSLFPLPDLRAFIARVGRALRLSLARATSE